MYVSLAKTFEITWKVHAKGIHMSNRCFDLLNIAKCKGITDKQNKKKKAWHIYLFIYLYHFTESVQSL